MLTAPIGKNPAIASSTRLTVVRRVPAHRQREQQRHTDNPDRDQKTRRQQQ
jgi:hypothetical protein